MSNVPKKIDKFVIYEETRDQRGYFSNFINEVEFYRVFGKVIDYEMLDPVRRKVAAWSKEPLTTVEDNLFSLFRGQIKHATTTMKYVHWRLYLNDGDIRASFMRNPNNPGDKLGLGGTSFELDLDVRFFKPNDVIIFEGLKEIPLMIISEAKPVPPYYRYEFVLLDASAADYFPVEFLREGAHVIQIDHPIGEANTHRGTVHLGFDNAYIEFRVPLNRSGWELKVTDDAFFASKNYRMVINPQLPPKYREEIQAKFRANGIELGTDPDSGTGVIFTDLELKFLTHVNGQKLFRLLYGRSNIKNPYRFLDSVTENYIETGPGLYEFLENAIVYDRAPNQNIVEMLQSTIPVTWNDKVPIDQRVVDVFTGTLGLMHFQRDAVKMDIKPIVRTEEYNYGDGDAYFTGRKGVILNRMQYTGFYVEPFGLIRIHYLPFLDSEVVETRKYDGFPITSSDFLVFNFGYGDFENANIYYIENKERSLWTYGIGNLSPFGWVDGSNPRAARYPTMLPGENAFKIVHECMYGLVIKDVSSMMWFRTNIV